MSPVRIPAAGHRKENGDDGTVPGIRAAHRAVPARAAGALLPPARHGGRGGGPRAGNVPAGLAFVRRLRGPLIAAHLALPHRHQAQDPAAILTARHSVRLALIASLQYLPARQRAVLLLREVLGFSAAEVAAMLGISAAAVKSTLQRARARLDEVAPAPESVIEPTEPHARDLLGQYIAGFENADTAALEKALRTDAAIELVGTRTWFSGRVTCLRFLAHVIGSPGDWLMTPTLANGQPAAAAYYRHDDGTHQALGVAVLTATSTGVARITVFPGGPPWWPDSASHPPPWTHAMASAQRAVRDRQRLGHSA